jgi:hypothetical protein
MASDYTTKPLDLTSIFSAYERVNFHVEAAISATSAVLYIRSTFLCTCCRTYSRQATASFTGIKENFIGAIDDAMAYLDLGADHDRAVCELANPGDHPC